MRPLPEILRSLFASPDIKPPIVTLETALNPVHEKDVYQGSEFLDDHIRSEDTEDNETNTTSA